MTQFVQVGNRWLNMEQVVSVEIGTGEDPERVPVSVHYPTGQKSEFLESWENLAPLRAWLACRTTKG